MKILVVDNYDSFTYNLVHIVEKYASVQVFRNDKITPEACLNYDGILLSPGPGLPKDAGNMPRIIEECQGAIPMLGICLGHQAIAEYLGAHIYNLPIVYHGKQSTARIVKDSELLKGLPKEFQIGRYHSWSINPKEINEKINITCLSEDGEIMAIENPAMKLYGVQFHPESVMTPQGETILKNFLNILQ